MKDIPIVDAVVEFHFEGNIPPQVMVGLMYSKLDKEIFKIEDQPILQLPAEVRQNDPNLKTQPIYKLVGDKYVVSVGDGIIGVSIIVDGHDRIYRGWDTFMLFINKVLKFINEFTVTPQVDTAEVRFISLFEDEGIFDKTNIKVTLNNKNIQDLKTTTVFFEESKDNIKLKTQLAGKATVKSPYLELKGSVIDISAKTDQPVGIGDLSQTINLLHDEVKSKIKSVLREAYQPKEI